MIQTGKRSATSDIGGDARRCKTSPTIPPDSAEEIREVVKSEPDESVVAYESVDKYGDLILRVGSDRKAYRVCSRTLARASPVLDAILYGPDSGPRLTSPDWIVDLPDDGDEELKLFLRISHGFSASVPASLSISELCKLLHFLERFEAIPVIRPWIQGWIKDLNENTKDDLRLLWISWTAGDSKLFRKVLRRIAESRSIGEDGNLEYDDASLELFPNDGSWMGSPAALLSSFKFWTATELTEAIIGTRKALIDAQLDPYWKLIDELENEKVFCKTGFRDIKVPRTCVARIAGILVMAFVRSGLGTMTALKTSLISYRGTVDDLTVTLKSNLSSKALRHCDTCKNWFMLGKPLPVHPEGGIINESRQDWLNARAAETGLSCTERDFWSTWEAAA